MQEIARAVHTACKDLFAVDADVVLTRPDEQFGDYATNVALQLSKQLGKNPREIAESIVVKIRENSVKTISETSVAGPGFINIRLTDQALVSQAQDVPARSYEGKTVLVEYLDPNPFKELHIGHAYSGTIGDSIGNLFSAAGAKVHRVTYQGDVGLHVAKALYGMQQELGDKSIDEIAESDRAAFLGRVYAAGATAYEEDESAKAEIQAINKKVYSREDESLNQLYDAGKAWSLEYFDSAYQTFGFTPFEKNYMEGAVAAEGLEIVKSHIADGVFSESDGAIVFIGEDHGLHTRVFVNAQGIPTYEAKDLGNAMQKWRDYAYDQSVIITAEEQTQYFKVMLKALEQFAPEQAHATTHIAHGMVKLSTGKMSSRTGKVLRALDVLDAVEQAAAEASQNNVHDVALAAIKYAFLKNRIGGDIAFDVNESVSLEGNSGPYLQYAYARARSILAKASGASDLTSVSSLEVGERQLARKLSEWAETVDKAVQDLMPHHICTYLYELAQTFNRFYEQNRVIDDPRQNERLALVSKYADVLNEGLTLLGIHAAERM
jgi:arginyl-tRNA synthetase